MSPEPKMETRVGLNQASKQGGMVSGWRKSFSLRRRTSHNLDVRSLERAPSSEIDITTSPSQKPPIAFISFCFLVLVPFFAGAFYYAFIASDQYISEARFAVRSVSSDSGQDSVDSGVLSMASVSQDAYVITSFIHSTEILRRLTDKIDYRALFSDKRIDFLSRLGNDASQEEILEYWDRQVQTNIDGPSGIVTLKVSSFDPATSQRLASLILTESDRLVNELSQRAKNDIISRAQEEVIRTEKLYQASLAALSQYQVSVGVLNPVQQADETVSLLSGLIAKKIELESRLFVLNSSKAQDSPTYRALTQQQTAIESQIEGLRATLTGHSGRNDSNLAELFRKFSELETDRLLAQKLYEAAQQNLTAAQVEALKKAIYMVVFVLPELAQLSMYPDRVASPLILGMIMFVVWLTCALVWASVEDHRL